MKQSINCYADDLPVGTDLWSIDLVPCMFYHTLLGFTFISILFGVCLHNSSQQSWLVGEFDVDDCLFHVVLYLISLKWLVI